MELKRTSIPECRANLLHCLRELLSNYYPFSKYQEIYDYCLQCLKTQSTTRIQTISLNTIRRFLELFPQDISSQPQKLLTVVVDIVRNRLK